MPGIQDFTRLNYGKETVRGTPVAPTRQFEAEMTGYFTEQIFPNLHRGENRGRRSEVTRVTQMGEEAALKVASVDGVAWDSLTWPITQLKGGLTGVGAGADKTWTATPNMTSAAGANNPESFSVDAGDDVQNWRLQYVMMKSWELSAGRRDVTQFTADCFAQRAIKTVAAAVSPISPTPAKIPGDLWTLKLASTFAGLPGAAVQTNLLLGWKLHVDTGLVWRSYQDGNLYGSQHVETTIGGTLELTVESTATTVSEFYDNWKSQAFRYARLKATGGALGGSAYSAQFDCPFVLEDVAPIDKQEDGINIYTVKTVLADDGTNPPISAVIVNSLAAIP